MNQLTGKSAIITGASSGIGRASAYALASEGCNLVLVARRQERLQEVKESCEKEYGVKVLCCIGDVRLEETAVKAVDLAVSEFGKVDILINNAGIGRLIKLVDSTVEDYAEMMDTNVFSSFMFSKYATIDMLKHHSGKIIFISSVTGHIGHADETIYTMTKFAQRGLSQAIDKELRREGIQTCVVCPSATKTEFEVGYGRTMEAVKTADWETPEDVAAGVLYASLAKNTVWEIRMR